MLLLQFILGSTNILLYYKGNFGIYNVTTCEKTLVMHILFNISRSKENPTMKFGLLIEYNI